MQQVKSKRKTPSKYLFQSLPTLLYLLLYTAWPLLLILLLPMQWGIRFDRFSASMFALGIYTVPATVASIALIVVDYFRDTCSAVYTFLTLNLLILSIVTSTLIK